MNAATVKFLLKAQAETIAAQRKVIQLQEEKIADLETQINAQFGDFSDQEEDDEDDPNDPHNPDSWQAYGSNLDEHCEPYKYHCYDAWVSRMIRKTHYREN